MRTKTVTLNERQAELLWSDNIAVVATIGADGTPQQTPTWVDWDGERATLSDALAGTEVPASRDNVGVTLQHQAMWARAFVTAGVRFEHNDSFGNATVPRITAAFYPRTGGDAVGATRISAALDRPTRSIDDRLQ